ARLFRQHAYECAAASTAGEALALMHSFRPHVVVLEPAFRDGSGQGLSARLRDQAVQEGRAVPNEILSVLDEEDAPGLSLEADHYFLKPTPIGEVIRVIRQLASGAPLTK